MIKDLQINLVGKSAAQDLEIQNTQEQGIIVIIASKYYKYGANKNEANG